MRNKSLGFKETVILTSVVAAVLLAYMYGSPLMYEGNTIPMAATTAIAFIFLGIALIASVGPRGFPMRHILGDSTADRLTRAFLPLIIVALFVQSILHRIASTSPILNDALLLAGLLVIASLITAYVVDRVASVIGSKIDEANRKLEQAREEQRATLLSIGDGVIVTDERGRITLINFVAETLTGWKNEQAKGKKLPEVFNIINAKTRKPCENPAEKVLETGLIVGLANHTLLIARDGVEYQIADSGAPIRDAEGKIIGTILVFRDVTQEHLIQEVLHENQAILQAAMDRSTAGIAIADAPRGTLRYVNDAGLLIRGGTREEVVNGVGIDKYVESWQLLDLDGRPLNKDEVPLARAIMFGETSSRDFIIRRPEGEDRVVHAKAAPISNADGKVTAGVVVFLDITEQKKAQRQQLLSVEILNIIARRLAIPDMMNSIICAIKRSTGFDAVGIRLKREADFPYLAQKGFSDDFLLAENTLVVRGKDGGICCDENGNVCLECTCGLVISGKTDPSNSLFTPSGSFWTNDSLPLLNLHADEDPRLHPRNRCIHDGYGSVALIPIREDEQIVGLLQLNDRKKESLSLDMINAFEGICINIGMAIVRNRAEEREKDLREKLERAARMESLGVLAGGVAHDLNNILGPIVLLPELVAEYIEKYGNPADPDHADNLESMQIMQESAKRAVNVVGDLVAMGRRGQFGKEPVDINSVVEKLLNSKQIRAMQAMHPSVHILKRNAEQPIQCMGSESRLERVLANLVGNAIESIDGHGDVTVKTDRCVLKEILEGFDTVPAGDYAVIEVADTGCGMDAQTITRIFEPFFSTKAPGERSGSGLGLSVVHGLVKDHAGFIDVKSRPGQGTIITVYIPAIKGSNMSTKQQVRPSLPGGNERILVIDDEPGQQILARQQLKKLGYNPTVVTSGEEAVSLIQKAHQSSKPSPFDLVIADMIMKGLNGLDTCKTILGMYPKQSLMIVSGHTPEHLGKEAYELGINWLAKPYSAEELAQMVRFTLDGKKVGSHA